jgi:tetratricopeptide (TPR) repeat protein
MNALGIGLLCAALFSGVATQAAQPPASRPGAANPLAAMASAYRAADRAFREGDYPLARALTIELTQRFATDAAVWLRLGQIEQSLGMFAQALAAYDRAIECEIAQPLDGGAQMAAIRYHRARLLVTEASNDLAASSALPLEARLADSREALRRALDMAQIADPLLPRVSGRESRGEKVRRPAKGYVVDVK